MNHDTIDWDANELVTEPDYFDMLGAPEHPSDLTSAIEGASWQALKSLGAV